MEHQANVRPRWRGLRRNRPPHWENQRAEGLLADQKINPDIFGPHHVAASPHLTRQSWARPSIGQPTHSDRLLGPVVN